MKNRFEGEGGRERLLEALLKCETVRSDRALAEALADAAELREHSADSLLIAQGAYDSDVAFLLSGEVCVLVGDRLVAHRSAGDHVGEMAAIDPRAARSAAVRATKLTVAAWVTESQIVEIANKHPRLWRAFAATLADRLRERGKLVRARRMESMVLFLGGSIAKDAQERLERALTRAHASLVHWVPEQHPSTLPLHELLVQAEDVDFAIVDLRCSENAADAVFELGLLMGSLGPARVFPMMASDTVVPSHLKSLIHLPCETEGWSDVTVDRIASRVANLGPR